MKESAFSKILRDDISFILGGDDVHKPHIHLIQDSYRSGKKPYDFYFTYYDSFYAIELKVCGGLSLELKSVQQNQIESLYEVEHSGKCGKGYIIILLEKYNKYKALVIPVYKWTKILKRYKGLSSVKLEHLFDVHPDWMVTMDREKVEGKLYWNVIDGILKYERDM